ncbi:hypothetical protein Fuma_06288 [Fuerstiella marisgermanici]|uniref:Uncharacterized protein n=1 Tax=Fuerstiella marisgermanici TaxID=1891926 RepID=A0A1P8WRC7_9PLAN|nr:hypothetical protein Fuma_06288 [Fuerstiella marisgermanici]
MRRRVLTAEISKRAASTPFTGRLRRKLCSMLSHPAICLFVKSCPGKATIRSTRSAWTIVSRISPSTATRSAHQQPTSQRTSHPCSSPISRIPKANPQQTEKTKTRQVSFLRPLVWPVSATNDGPQLAEVTTSAVERSTCVGSATKAGVVVEAKSLLHQHATCRNLSRAWYTQTASAKKR